MRKFPTTILLCVATSAGCCAFGRAAGVAVHADLREASRGLLHATLRIEAKPGPMTLLYARWIPGEHGPTGPVTDLAITKMSAGGRAVAWRRDLENMYAIQVDVPAGATALEVTVDYLAPAGGNFGSGPTTSAKLAVLNWFIVTLYPAGAAAADIAVAPSVTLPDGWDFGGSLAVAERRGAEVTFAPVSLEMLLDQPVIAGAMMKHFELTPGATPAHVIDCAADSEAALAIPAERLKAFQRVPGEYAAVFGARHFETYHFLLSLSERTGVNGVEHHQCSDNRAPERYLADDDVFLSVSSLLTHEFFHSWNGKHRRPEGLSSPDYQKPMHTDLLWIYEGLTQYYGEVMAARAGLVTVEQYREVVANEAGWMASRSGRTWRPLQDTADAAQLLYAAGGAWGARRRGADFYAEGTLIWLEADAVIRKESGGARSLDDFARFFFGDGGGGAIDPAKVAGRRPTVEPYEAADVFAALNRVQPHDWVAFFAERLTATGAEPPLGGIARAGWKPVYTDQANAFAAAAQKRLHVADFADSLGLIVHANDHTIVDVIGGSPADRAGAAPGMKLVGVNGRVYSDELLAEALKTAGEWGAVELLVENAGYLSTLRHEYRGGARHPHLERASGMDDLLAAITKPRV